MTTLSTGDDAFVVLHDEFRQLMLDALGSYQAVAVLTGLLRLPTAEVLDGTERAGLAVLLEAVLMRLELVVDGLRDTAGQLGISSTPEPV